MATETYSNGCPKVGWCVACERHVGVQSIGELTVHRNAKNQICYSGWITIEDARTQREAHQFVIKTSKDGTRDLKSGQWFAEAYRLPETDDSDASFVSGFCGSEREAVSEVRTNIRASFPGAAIRK